MLGFCVGGNVNIRLGASGLMHIFAFLDTNMLVSPMRNSGVGGLDQRKAPTRKFCVAVEYRLMSFNAWRKDSMRIFQWDENESPLITSYRISQ